jgi:phenolic acid decarboxylase
MSLKEIGIGDVVRIKRGKFVSADKMTVVAIKESIATVSWKEPCKKGIKEVQANVSVNELVHEKTNKYNLNGNLVFDVCLN